MSVTQFLHEPYGKFLKELYQQSSLHGEIMENYVLLIRKATAWYVLQESWPEQALALKGSDIAYAVSEIGWRGSLEKIASGLYEGLPHEMTLRKSFVMDARVILAVVKYKNEFALLLISRDHPGLDWCRREEPESIFPVEPSRTVSHFTLQCEKIPFHGDFISVKKRQLQSLTMNVFRRELFGYAVLASGLDLYFQNARENKAIHKLWNFSDEMEIPPKTIFEEAKDYLRNQVAYLANPAHEMHPIWAWLSRKIE